VTSSRVPGGGPPRRVGRCHVWSELAGFFPAPPQIPAHIAPAATPRLPAEEPPTPRRMLFAIELSPHKLVALHACLDDATMQRTQVEMWCDNHPMEERELKLWLDALVEQGFFEEWHWTVHVEPGQAAAVSYLIDGRRYTLEGAIRLIRDFEAALVSL
jgi:hypothetical protein